MKNYYNYSCSNWLLVVFLLFTLNAYSQFDYSKNYNPWKVYAPSSSEISSQSLNSPIKRTSFYTLDSQFLSQLTPSLPKQTTIKYLTLPLPQNKFETYLIKEIIVLPPKLATKFPSIKTYKGVSNNGLEAWISIDSNGLHATMNSKEGSIYLDALKDKTKIYKSYYKKDASSQSAIFKDETLEVPGSKPVAFGILARMSNVAVNNETLRAYRLAVATTGEYTQYHGGSVENALGAVVTAITRVNAIFEREIGVRFILVENNDRIIYTDPDNDPFTDGDTYKLIDENQTVLNDSIGVDNYDVGHVFFGKSFSGLAYVGSVCNNLYKAGAASGHPQPDADPFFVDVLSHELGHQFGAYHSHNADCNRTASSAYEPGSGSTIMSYTGICPPNLQKSSDDYFHAGSIAEMLAYLNFTSCGTEISTENVAPEISNMPESGISIPKSTFFELTANAIDANNDNLVYAWDQIDTGPQTTPNEPEGNAPLFRSFPFSSNPTRYFPQLSTQLTGEAIFGEILPDYSREMNFRFIVRDLNGGTSYQDTKILVDGEAGPFSLQENNLEDNYYFDQNITITWDVANTDEAPINCEEVDILLSLDNGKTFNEILVTNTANDGRESVKLPRIETDSARIKVKASENYFYTISQKVFSIEQPPFSISIPQDTLFLCGNESRDLSLISTNFASSTEEILIRIENVPAPFIAVAQNERILPGQSTLLNFNTNASTNDTVLQVKVIGTTNDFQFSDEFFLSYSPSLIDQPILLAPLNKISDASLKPTFEWEAVNQYTKYDFELADDSDFNNILFSQSNLKQNSLSLPIELEPSSRYYWRVKATNSCGMGNNSETFSFTTLSIVCDLLAANDLPKSIFIEENSVVISEIEVNQVGLVQEVVVQNIAGKHSFISDLKMELVSPDNTRLLLLNKVCNDEDNFNLGFDDNAKESVFDCPPVNGTLYKPVESLTTLQGKVSQGIWQLVITDLVNQDGGQLDNWELQLCIKQPNFSLTGQATNFDEVSLSWEFSQTGILNYEIERRTDSQESFEVISIAGSEESSYTDNGLEDNTTYYYRIKANLTNNQFAYSAIEEIQTLSSPPLAPSNLRVQSKGLNNISFLWNDNSSNETGFQVFRTNPSSSTFNLLANLPENITVFNDTGLQENTIYRYIVSAVGIDTKSYSDTLTVKTIGNSPNPPNKVKATSITTDNIKLSWVDNADNELKYVVLRGKQDESSFVIVGDLPINTESFEDVGLQENTQYQYIIGVVGTDSTTYSDTLVVKTLTLPPAKPDNLNAIDLTFNSVTIIWNDNATNETAYRIRRKKGNETSFRIITELETNITSYVDNSLEGNTGYTYTVEAVRADTSSFSEELTIQTLIAPPEAPDSLIITQINSKEINLSWQDIARNEINYLILRETANVSKLDTLITTTANVENYTDTLEIAFNTTYTYYIYALNNGGASSPLIGTITTLNKPPKKPSNLLINNIQATQFTASWLDNSENESQFEIQISEADSLNFIDVRNVSKNITTTLIDGLKPETLYFCKVRAVNNGGNSDFTAAVPFTTSALVPLTPENLQFVFLPTREVKLFWENKEPKQVAVIIERSQGSNKEFEQIGITNIGDSTYTDADFTAGNQYFYRVAAFNGTNNSDYSNEIFVSSNITSTEHDLLNELTIYPNPIQAYIYIEKTNNSLAINSIQITDITGRIMLKKSIKNTYDNERIRINTTTFPKGMFILIINDVASVKLIKR